MLEISEEGDVTVLGSSIDGGTGLPRTSSESPAEADARDAYAQAARRHGIDPGLLRAIAWTESRGRNSAVSPKGAIGIMQLMPGTAASLGVNPHDPLANIDGGAAYFARQLATFRTVPLALAAYNAGPGAVARYRGVPPYDETRRYVGSILRRWGGSSLAGFPSTAAAALAPVSATPAVAQPPQLSVMLIEVSSQ
ncbi:MAG: lytic transglycosylase domain-containing protein [Pseudomonadota bacterium]